MAGSGYLLELGSYFFFKWMPGKCFRYNEYRSFKKFPSTFTKQMSYRLLSVNLGTFSIDNNHKENYSESSPVHVFKAFMYLSAKHYCCTWCNVKAILSCTCRMCEAMSEFWRVWFWHGLVYGIMLIRWLVHFWMRGLWDALFWVCRT